MFVAIESFLFFRIACTVLRMLSLPDYSILSPYQTMDDPLPPLKLVIMSATLRVDGVAFY